MAEDEERCEIANKLDCVHKWIHLCREDITEKESMALHALAQKLTVFINEADEIDGVKVLALFAVMSAGVDAMERKLTSKTLWPSEHDQTIH